MTRIILIFFLTLTFSCGNKGVEPAELETATELTTEDLIKTPKEVVTKTEAAKVVEAPKAEVPKMVAKVAKPKVKSKKVGITVEPAPVMEPKAQVAETATPVAIETPDEPAMKLSAEPTTPATDPTMEIATVAISETATIQTPTKSRVKPKRFLPTRRRMDRDINKLKFAYKGEVMMGLTASYGTLSSEDTEFLVILNNITASATIASVKPFFGYFYRDNRAIGARFGYSHINGSIKSAAFDMGASNDMSGDLPKIKMASDSYSVGIFHRSYAGLDPKGRFGLFAEFELSASTGSSEFTYEQDGVPKQTFSDNTQLSLSFNPGAAVYIFPNVCATLSFGLGGVEYTKVTQKDAQGKITGSRESSKMRFKLNIAAINFGMNIHLWDKKKR